MPGNIIDFVGHRERIFPIGRLDKDSEGLILLTNDGDIVNEVLREEHGHEKEYLVTVEPDVTDNFLAMMGKGVRIGGEKTKPAKVTRVRADTFRIVLTQGLNRQIRRMCSALGWRVKRLVRTRIMHIRLGDLPAGRWRELTRVRAAAPPVTRLAATGRRKIRTPERQRMRTKVRCPWQPRRGRRRCRRRLGELRDRRRARPIPRRLRYRRAAPQRCAHRLPATGPAL